MPKDKDGRARRTVKACVICHKKKIRCDVDDVNGEICTPCQRDGYECVPRERKRKRFTFSPSPPAGQTRIKTQDGDSSVLENIEAHYSTIGLTHASVTESSGRAYGASAPSESEFGRRMSSTASLDASPILDRHADLEYPMAQHNMSSNMSQRAYQTANSVSYLGRLEYLRGEVPVNDDAGVPDKVPHRLSESDVTILKVQRVADLPPRAVRDSLMDAFWTRCYPWTPVVERAWIYDRRPGKVSLLLQQAMSVLQYQTTHLKTFTRRLEYCFGWAPRKIPSLPLLRLASFTGGIHKDQNIYLWIHQASG
jgi:hypothetical protein